jgi:hypothetical protein
VLLIFGNPPLGTQFITANANAGLDWPVRLLVYENEKGEVWTAYTDFGRCGSWSTRTRRARCGLPILILAGSLGVTESITARISSRWHRASSRRSLRAYGQNRRCSPR